jgi:hypothetical protein
MLRPELYRPAPKCVSLKPIQTLLEIENDLLDEFQRSAVVLSNEKTSEEDWDWDSYFLMQHHNGPTRLLDWTDGALMALHFAVRKKDDDEHPACVYVLEPDRLKERLEQFPDREIVEAKWKDFVANHPSCDFGEDEWEYAYLPWDKDERVKKNVPQVPRSTFTVAQRTHHATNCSPAQSVHPVRDGTRLAIG